MDGFMTNYDGELENQDDCCLRFPYKNHKLGRSDYLTGYKIPRYGSISPQNSRVCVYCCDCHTYMRYKERKERHFEGWTCPECKERVSLEMIMDQIRLEEMEVMEQILLKEELKATIKPINPLGETPHIWDEVYERISQFFYN